MTILITNVQIYRTIAIDSFKVVKSEDAIHRRPKPDGSTGYIITPDPEQKSFKHAMVCIVFAGMWYEALIHLIMVDRFGESKTKEWDRRSYRNKFEKLGCTDHSILSKIQQFADSRNDLMHEKAHWNQDKITNAQKEAARAIDFITTVDSFIGVIPYDQPCGESHTSGAGGL